jgi:hypothetical protein
MGLYNPKQFDNKSFLIGEKKLIDLNLPYVSADPNPHFKLTLFHHEKESQWIN